MSRGFLPRVEGAAAEGGRYEGRLLMEGCSGEESPLLLLRSYRLRKRGEKKRRREEERGGEGRRGEEGRKRGERGRGRGEVR